VIGRRITRPLVALTGAAEAVARGDYGARVEPRGDDELRRLAESFNHMAARVGAAREALQAQTREARAAAEELEAREAQFRALANAIPQLSWMAHPDGSIFWLNERYCEYTGRTPAQLEGWGWQSVHDPAVLPLVMERWRASIATGQQFEMEYPLRAADGSSRWFLARAHPVRDTAGCVVRWFGTGTDVQALRDAREAAEAASRAKSDFLAMMSHELRTPLNAIGGYTELLQLGLRGPLTDAQQRDLGRIRTSQEHLLGLISGVLDLSRIEAGRVSYDLAPMALSPFLAGLDALIEPQAAAKSLVLQHLPTPRGLGAMADREKLRQILLNLLSNAIRYTPAGGRVELAAASVSATMVAISVSDTGGGIDPEMRDRIFEPFVQLDRSLTRVREGVGLGLAISRDLARGMGGDLTVESEPGAGSRFTVTLPRVTVPEGEALTDASDEFPVARGAG
ncbi:MAG TPA: ATP-binding protein, partial [Gemmatimonadaceae bacterium]|nr:ATP-binding protein [Gemmatimonadaceae bacterium]